MMFVGIGSRRTRCAAIVGAVVIGLVQASIAHAGGWRDAHSPPPGPAILYAPPARSAQLQNAPGSPWRATPILISGTSAYRAGEFLYQDYLFDDQGAGGTYTYPTDPRYAKDAADLVEFRLRPVRGGLLMRLTFNSMIDPDLVASTIALGGEPGTSYPLPFGARASEPARTFVTVHGSTVLVSDPASGKTLEGTGAFAVADIHRRQVTVFVPESVIETSTAGSVRVAEASGLWDAAHDEYLQPVAGSATATQPGNGGTSGGALFNVAFRFGEGGTWMNNAQSAALAARDLSRFYEDVDFAKLRSRVTDNMYDQPDGVPTHGQTYRIYASHFEDIQGRGAQPGTRYCHEPCWPATGTPDFGGQLQPYALYVPDKPAPRGGYGMTLNLHYCGGNYTAGPPDAAALADRASGSVVLTPEDRGGCYWYWSEAGADTFEAWADVARHFRLDPRYNAISGWSMGGYGTYKLAAEFPDLFAAALPDIGCVSAETGWPGEPTPSISGEDAEIVNLVPSYRNVPFLMANAAADQFCLNPSQNQVLNRLEQLGYRFDWREYDGTHGPYYPTDAESAAFLDDLRVNPNPPHVSWVDDGGMQEPKWGLTSNHVYWLSDIEIRDASVENDLGDVDAFSHGFGLADPAVNGPTPESGTGSLGPGGVPYTYTGLRETWQPPASAPIKDELDLTLTNLSHVMVDVGRARLWCHAMVNVNSDGPATVNLAGCHRTIEVR